MAADSYQNYDDPYAAQYGMPDTSNGSGPTGVPDPNNPGYDTAGYPLGAGAVAPPITGGSWGAGTPQANGVAPTFTPTTPTGPVTNAGGQVWGGGGPSGNFDTNGKPMSFSGPGDSTTPPSPPPTPPPAAPNLGGGALAPYGAAAPQLAPEPAYTPTPFQAPSIDEALTDPGYQFEKNQSLDALQRWAAAKGTLNDTGTATALMDVGRNAATQRLGDVWGRAFTGWNANEQANRAAYGMNRQSQFIDPWTAQYNAWQQQGNWYNQNQGLVANTALGFAQL